MLTELSALHQRWREAEARTSAAERDVMDTIRKGELPDTGQVQAVRQLRARASECLRRLLSATERASRACR